MNNDFTYKDIEADGRFDAATAQWFRTVVAIATAFSFDRPNEDGESDNEARLLHVRRVDPRKMPTGQRILPGSGLLRCDPLSGDPHDHGMVVWTTDKKGNPQLKAVDYTELLEFLVDVSYDVGLEKASDGRRYSSRNLMPGFVWVIQLIERGGKTRQNQILCASRDALSRKEFDYAFVDAKAPTKAAVKAAIKNLRALGKAGSEEELRAFVLMENKEKARREAAEKRNAALERFLTKYPSWEKLPWFVQGLNLDSSEVHALYCMEGASIPSTQQGGKKPEAEGGKPEAEGGKPEAKDELGAASKGRRNAANEPRPESPLRRDSK